MIKSFASGLQWTMARRQAIHKQVNGFKIGTKSRKDQNRLQFGLYQSGERWYMNPVDCKTTPTRVAFYQHT